MLFARACLFAMQFCCFLCLCLLRVMRFVMIIIHVFYNVMLYHAYIYYKPRNVHVYTKNVAIINAYIYMQYIHFLFVLDLTRLFMKYMQYSNLLDELRASVFWCVCLLVVCAFLFDMMFMCSLD